MGPDFRHLSEVSLKIQCSWRGASWWPEVYQCALSLNAFFEPAVLKVAYRDRRRRHGIGENRMCYQNGEYCKGQVHTEGLFHSTRPTLAFSGGELRRTRAGRLLRFPQHRIF